MVVHGLNLAERATVGSGIKASALLVLLAMAAVTPPALADGAGALRPETTIVKHPPSRTSSPQARFSFRSDKFSASFGCKLDAGPFEPCRSPFLVKVKPGRHSFQVRAFDSLGADLTPATFRWRVS